MSPSPLRLLFVLGCSIIGATFGTGCTRNGNTYTPGQQSPSGNCTCLATQWIPVPRSGFFDCSCNSNGVRTCTDMRTCPGGTRVGNTIHRVCHCTAPNSDQIAHGSYNSLVGDSCTCDPQGGPPTGNCPDALTPDDFFVGNSCVKGTVCTNEAGDEFKHGHSSSTGCECHGVLA
eukprot:TRINITY_DN17587_c0_g1_i2.p2 TRINITY_DN17587_c0_g1~~TRINITY_DN17587_c0_g1_i2.p2  ORF type:complete len:174 (-),score=0.14 TRINITY_DN17587_c0_g1_i2:91-612(-)